MFYLILFQMMNTVYTLSIRSENPFDRKYFENTKETIQNSIFGNGNITTVEPSSEEKLYNEIWFYAVIALACLVLCCLGCFIRKCCC